MVRTAALLIAISTTTHANADHTWMCWTTVDGQRDCELGECYAPIFTLTETTDIKPCIEYTDDCTGQVVYLRGQPIETTFIKKAKIHQWRWSDRSPEHENAENHLDRLIADDADDEAVRAAFRKLFQAMDQDRNYALMIINGSALGIKYGSIGLYGSTTRKEDRNRDVDKWPPRTAWLLNCTQPNH